MQEVRSSTNQMTKRLTISLDDDVYDFLEPWAEEEVRTVANLASALVTLAVRKKQQEQNPPESEEGK